jgi:SNF2 family DNA or RNA helicase
MDFDWRNDPSNKGKKRRTLIVAQKNGLAVWKYHLEALGVPSEQILVIDPKDRTEFDQELADGAFNYAYYIVHWNVLILLENLVPSIKSSVKPIVWDCLIGDEIQFAKNRNTKRTKAFKKIKARKKIGCSGTPADDKPQDFWSILNWLYPREFSAYWAFFNKYLDWENSPQGYRLIKGTKNIAQLHDKIRPFYIRRKLTEVIKDMPDKSYREIRVQMTPRMKRDYKAMEKYQTAQLGEMEEEFAVVYKISMYMRLLQMTAGTCEVDWTKYEKFWDKWEGTPDDKMPKKVIMGPTIRITDPSPKIDALMEEIETNEEEQFVVFTNFLDVVGLVEARCKKAGIPVSKITGQVISQKVRDAAVADFQSGKTRVFVGTVKAAGTSITLTAAHTLIFLDRNWNPSINSQAEDRIWRIGQKNACQIIDIIMDETLDEPRVRRIWHKAKNVQEVVDIPKLSRLVNS